LLLSEFLKNPFDGKTIVLAGSKRAIEFLYITYTQLLEEKNVTLICQGLSGGLNRMESEFLAASGTTVWILTPWMYEGTDLPRESVDRIVVEALPFDHPGQPIFSKRKDHHRNGFEAYALPRVECRMFRLLRTFCRQRKENGEMIVVDKRLHEKAYGRRVMHYLSQFAEKSTAIATKKDEGQMKLF
jgi:ATP-dependent DNA helicase DinG